MAADAEKLYQIVNDLVSEGIAPLVDIAYPQHDGDITLSVEDSTKLREAYKQKVQGLRNEFEKRLDAYLKKYGLSKIRRWTYCADD